MNADAIITIDARKCGTTIIWNAPWQVRTNTGNGGPPRGVRVEGTLAQRVIAAVLLALPMVSRDAFFAAGRHTRQVQARECAAWVLRDCAGLSLGAISGILRRDPRMVAEAVRRAGAKIRRGDAEFTGLWRAVAMRAGLMAAE